MTAAPALSALDTTSVTRRLSALDRYLPVWIFAAMAAGLLLGRTAPGLGPVLDRFRVQASVFALLPVVFLTASNIPVLVACAFVVGLGTAPTLITAFGLVGELVASTSLTEGLAWIITGLNLGYGIGSSVVGGIANTHGARVAFTVTIASGLAMGALALGLWRRLTVAPAPRDQVSV